jgi:hypothetical protein
MPPSSAMTWSAGDIGVVTDLHDAASHPRGDVILDVADAGPPGDRSFGRLAHVPDAGRAPRGGGGLQVLRIAPS